MAGVSNEIQLIDALLKLQSTEGLNVILMDASIYNCGNKIGYLSANLEVGMQDPKTKENIITIFNKYIKYAI